MTDRGSDIFIDKLKLTTALVDKELQVNQLYNRLRKLLKSGEISYLEANTHPLLFDTWELLVSLFDVIEFDYSVAWGNLKGNKEKYQRLTEILEKYRSEKDAVLFNDLQEGYNIIREIMAWSNFHNVQLKKSSIPKLTEPDTEWY